jgi:hypothetical protein
MEFGYFPVNAVVRGESDYDWTPLESFLRTVATHGIRRFFAFISIILGSHRACPGI